MDNLDQAQNTDEWHKERCGKFTASEFVDVISLKKDGTPTKARSDLIWRIASERIQGYQVQGVSAYSLKWGKDNENFAKMAYEIATGEFIENVRFINHSKYDFVGFSPDGLIGTQGTIEAKCPSSPVIHLQRWSNGFTKDDEYYPQVQGGLWVTNRQWCDFISYDPDTSIEFKLLIIRVYRDEPFILNLEKEIVKANIEVNALIENLKKIQIERSNTYSMEILNDNH